MIICICVTSLTILYYFKYQYYFNFFIKLSCYSLLIYNLSTFIGYVMMFSRYMLYVQYYYDI